LEVQESEVPTIFFWELEPLCAFKQDFQPPF
jgi:hypothetical protein